MIRELNFVREAPVSASVGWWNQMDLDHLTVVHAGYVRAEVLDETDHAAVLLLRFRVPFFPWVHSRSIHYVVKRPPDELLVFNQGLFGIPIFTRIRITELAEKRSRYETWYRFHLEGWRRALSPFLGPLVRRWNERTWREDLPLKIRRQERLDAGFPDSRPAEDRFKISDYALPRGDRRPVSDWLFDWRAIARYPSGSSVFPQPAARER